MPGIWTPALQKLRMTLVLAARVGMLRADTDRPLLSNRVPVLPTYHRDLAELPPFPGIGIHARGFDALANILSIIGYTPCGLQK